MALVGDLLIDVRTMGPDLAPLNVQSPPGSELTVGQVVFAPTTLPLATYFVKLTYRNPWGETLAGAESAGIVVDAGHTIGITGILPANTTLRVYYGTTVGAENQFVETTTVPFQVTTFGQPGQIPVRNSAYLPDSDGGFVSAARIYQWLNDALKEGARLTGGIQDWGGIGSVANQPQYAVTQGKWLKFLNTWYDGWELEQGSRADVFRNNAITASISRLFCLNQNSAQQVVELFYIPSRSAAVTTLTAPVNPGDTSITVASSAGFTGPPLGLVQVGPEVMLYNTIAGFTLNVGPRGLSGTTSTAVIPANSPVKELNILWDGMRLPAVYSPGQAFVALDVPPAWEQLLVTYMLSKFRRAEQEFQEASSLMKEFNAEMTAIARSNKQIAGPRQARMFDTVGFRGVVPTGGAFGIIIR